MGQHNHYDAVLYLMSQRVVAAPLVAASPYVAAGAAAPPVPGPFPAKSLCPLLESDRAEVRRSFITTTVRDKSQVTPQGRHRRVRTIH